MKKLLIALLVIAVAYAVGAAVFAVANGQAEGKIISEQKQILLDGDMEKSGTSDWTAEAGAVLTKESGAHSDGNQVLRVTWTQIASKASQSILTVGKTYKVTGWARGSGSGGGAPQITGAADDVKWMGTNGVGWQRVEVTYVADSVLLRLRNNGGGYNEWDDVFVTEYTGDMTNAEKQIFVDGNMEKSGTSDWTAHTYATISKEAGARVDGRQLMRVTNNSAAAHTMAFNQDALTVGQKYKVTGWMRKSVSVSANVFVTIGNVHAWDGDLTSTDWQYFEGVAVADDTPVKFYGGFMDIGEYAEWDDIVVTEYAGETVQQEKQLLADGNMERSGTGDWAAVDSAVISKQPGGAYDGKQFLRVSGGGGGWPRASQTILTIGKRYHITGWARGNGSKPPIVFDGPYAPWYGTVSTEWQYIDFIRTALTTSLGLGLNSTVNYVEFDDIFVTEL